jgi:hypothetical protein
LTHIILNDRAFRIVQMKGNVHAQGEIIAKESKYTEIDEIIAK